MKDFRFKKMNKLALALSLLLCLCLPVLLSYAQDSSIPPIDKTGKKYLASEFQVGTDTYQLYFYYSKGVVSGGFQDFDWLSAVLYKNNNMNNSLFPSDIGGKVQMPLDTIPNYTHPKTFQERWDSFVSRLAKEINDLNITGDGSAVLSDEEMGWLSAFGRLALGMQGDKLSLLVDGVAVN